VGNAKGKECDPAAAKVTAAYARKAIPFAELRRLMSELYKRCQTKGGAEVLFTHVKSLHDEKRVTDAEFEQLRTEDFGPVWKNLPPKAA
jgi:hypothetical protein